MLTISADFAPKRPDPPRISPGETGARYDKDTSRGSYAITSRPPLRTPHVHLYRFGSRKQSHDFSPRAESPYLSTSPLSTPLQPLSTHPAFRKKKASHVPIVISQEIIDRVAKASPRSERSASLWKPQHKERISLVDALKEPPRPRHTPIVIPDFAQPGEPESFKKPVPLANAETQLVESRLPLTVNLEPLTPLGSDCATPRASVIRIRAPPTPPYTMSRPTTSNSMTMDSSIMQPGTFDSFNRDAAELSASQHSFTSETSQAEEKMAIDTQGHTKQNSYASPPQSAKTITSPTVEPRTPTSSSGNLSGLVCNVHRCTGKEPRGLVGATTTVLGDKLYVFGGRSLSRRHPHMTSDLYELDLVHRHWSKIRTKGQVPSPRYFHSVCGLGDNKLICYGGMSPAPQSSGAVPPTPTSDQSDVVVMSDVHIYDVKTRTWTKIDIQDPPQGRYAHCAAVLPSTSVFSSSNAPLSAIHHNPSEGENPNSGQLGIALDGTGGAEMVVVGGQDNANHYIEQVSVFNLRSLKWTATNSLGRSCGAYRSVVAPFVGFPASKIGTGIESCRNADKGSSGATDANSMLIYSNYNFLDVKLELQVRTQDGKLEEKAMSGPLSPPGLRFPNGGVLNNHFVISGTYLTSSRQEYALWALDLRTMTWSRIDVGGSVFGQGSWNRGVLWPRRNTFVVLGNRKRNLVEDYNHRRINFTNICLVELEAFGLYDNPRHRNPTSGYNSYSAPMLPPGMRPKNSLWSGGGRPHFAAAEELGKLTLDMKELADMDIMTNTGERIPANSHMLARRWGAYFISILRNGANSTQAAAMGRGFDAMTIAADLDKDTNTIRPPATYRNSSVTITPSLATTYTAGTSLTVGSQNSGGGATLTSAHGHSPSIASAGSTLTNGTNGTHQGTDDAAKPFHAPSPASLPAPTRSRTLYLPHTPPTVRALLHFLYTSSLPPAGDELSSPQVLCSLLQLARPYRIDGLLEAVLQRLHETMDGRSAAAVFNACAMAAGGGRGTGFEAFSGGSVMVNEAELDEASDALADERNARSGTGVSSRMTSQVRGAIERKNAFAGATNNSFVTGQDSTDVSEDETSGTDTENGSMTDSSDAWDDGSGNGRVQDEEVWTGEKSCVIGLQKRGLRGLMEGRRMRERGESSARTATK